MVEAKARNDSRCDGYNTVPGDNELWECLVPAIRRYYHSNGVIVQVCDEHELWGFHKPLVKGVTIVSEEYIENR
jgi:hypothetical protein